MIRPEQQPLLGILGGMGPLATVDFLGKLTRSLPVGCDQEHLPWITLSQPGMPDRSQSIQSGSDAPLPYLRKGVAWLAEQGVSLTCIPCSTSHFWFDRVQEASTVPVLHIADATIEELMLSSSRQAGPVAILATRGTIKSGIYRERLLRADCEVVDLSEEDQGVVDGIIRDVKAGKVADARNSMQGIQALLASRGIRTVILGCTELPLAHDAASAPLLGVDVSLALARVSLRRLGYTPGEPAHP